MQEKPVIAVLITVHNRKETTIEALNRLSLQKRRGEHFKLLVVITDDASTDGTADAIKKNFPETVVVAGNGQLYWGGGTRKAFREAAKHSPDFYLMLNDDTHLSLDAISRALDVYAQKSEASDMKLIVVGATREPGANEISYGGLERCSTIHPFRYRKVKLQADPQPCDTFNGNFVLIHQSVVDAIGFLDERFTHRFGDIDYGLVAAKAGIKIYVLPETVGECLKNDGRQDWDSADLSFFSRLKEFFDVKGLPINESYYFCRKHGGKLWLVWWIMPIVRGLFFPTRPAQKRKKNTPA